MHFEFLVEELSAETALYNLIPKIVGPDISYYIRVFQGKFDLLKKLPDRLRGYRPWLPDDWLIIVLLDKDREDCVQLKAKMEEIARQEGLSTKSNPSSIGKIQVMNRIAIEELEAWFFGDVVALKTAYPRIPKALDKKSKYRNPDAIDGTCEALERILKRAGYYRGGLPKKEVARKVSEYMDPDRNTSKSFQVFRDSLCQMLN
jgi:hypothetical protein